jgi:hypothetical protein
MSRIPLPASEGAAGTLKESYDAARARYGVVPNGVRTMGVSPEGGQRQSHPIRAGARRDSDRAAQRMRLLPVRPYPGRAAGLSDAELAASRDGRSWEPRAAAILRFAGAVLNRRGEVDDAGLAAAYDAGLTTSTWSR